MGNRKRCVPVLIFAVGIRAVLEQKSRDFQMIVKNGIMEWGPVIVSSGVDIGPFCNEQLNSILTAIDSSPMQGCSMGLIPGIGVCACRQLYQGLRARLR